MRFALQLAYDGTRFHGWQKQENAITVQGEIEKCLAQIFQKEISILGCGRTDTGVHARNYTAHFDLENELPDKFLFKINSLLPDEIAIKNCTTTHAEFHARFDAIMREYAYHIHFEKDPFLIHKSWERYGHLDFELMNAGADYLIGNKDCTCFCKGEAPNDNFYCQIYSAQWEYSEKQAVFRISANRFLRNMVRAIVGTLVDLGMHKYDLDTFKKIVDTGTRSDAGNSVPAHGLYLEQVKY